MQFLQLYFSSAVKSILHQISANHSKINSNDKLHLFYNKMTKDQLQHQQSRKYFALIQKVGSWHKYQFIIFLIMFMINILESSLIFLVPYLLNQASYTCPNLSPDKCTTYVCKLNQNDRKSYLPTVSPFRSLADDIGDFRCERSHELIAVQSFIFIGAVIGLTSFALFTQKFGRKNSLLLSLVLCFIGQLLIFFSSNLTILSIGLFVTFSGIQNSYQYTYCYASEVVAQQHRITYVNAFSIAYGVGIMMNSFTFYSIKNWKMAFLLFYIIPTLITIAAIMYFIEKTPVDLMATENTDQIFNSLNRVAKINGVENHGIKKQEIEVLREEYHAQSKGNFYTLIDICRFKSLRNIALPLIAINFLCNFLFYAPSFIMKSANVDLYRDNIVSGISFIISCLISQIILKLFPRKQTCYINNALTALMAAILAIKAVQQNSVLKPLFYFLFRTSVSVYLNVVYLLNFQSFPTQIRATSANFCYIFAETAGTLQPQTISFFEKNGVNLNLVFMVVALISIMATIPMKQTFDIPPPEVIQQLQHMQSPQAITGKPENNESI